MLSPPSSHITTTRVVVRPNDMDADRNVNNAVYFDYFYQARLEHLRRLGVYDAENPLYANLLALAENTCRYLAPAYYGDVLILWTATHAVGTSSFQLVYHVWREHDEQLIALGHSVQVWLGETKQSTPLPSGIRQALTAALYPELPKPSDYQHKSQA
ncbi:MAG: hypothetical protein ETSY1_35255 [Candidatus Entotheonella factor]|uniref:Thioesterase domain-containing protein n=1 Tax=Entotheonella factor TaxID=1429438 RepID=W4L9K1_ENTF1|nr:MAG: hypothetical protein ETSY1_35255 [Candidatus Entotheonella factor]